MGKQSTMIFDIRNGEMIHRKDKTRNISFRVDTINIIFNLFFKALRRRDEEIAISTFLKCGRICGFNFGLEVRKKWTSGGSVENKDLIEKWCAFDTSVGLGEFSSRDIVEDELSKTISGIIEVKGNFLATQATALDSHTMSTTDNCNEICAFFRGYCEGCLHALLNKPSVKILCANRDSCFRGTDNHTTSGYCAFNFKTD